MRKTNSKIKPVAGLIKRKGVGYPLAVFVAVCGLLFASCGAQKEVPVKTEIIVRDSLIYTERIDTTWITLPPVYVKDYSSLKDTLWLPGIYETAWSAVDEARGILTGAIESTGKPIPVQTVEKEKIVKKDTLIYQDRPVYVEKPVRYVPKFHKVFSTLGIIWTLLFLVLLYLKIRKMI